MHMVGHDDEFILIQFDIWPDLTRFKPFLLRNLPRLRQINRAMHRLPKQTFPSLRHYGDKIRPCLGVVVTFQPDRAAVRFLRSGCGYLTDRMIQSALCSISAARCAFAWLS